MSYPAFRHSVVNGALVSEVIHSKEGEREGWEKSPHQFRPQTVPELISQGHAPEEAAALHKRELHRVKLVFAGHSLDEAHAIAYDGEAPAVADSKEAASLKSDNASLSEKLDAAVKEAADKQALIDEMSEKFSKNWAKLEAERDKLKAENAQLKKKAAKPERDPEPAEEKPQESAG